MKTKTFTGVTILALLVAATAFAGDAEPFRPWSETGDVVGGGNHATLGFERLDAFGYEGRAAEDWSRLGQDSFTGLFAWERQADGGHNLLVRGFGENRADGEFSGAFDVRAGTPGTYAAKAIYRRANRFYDGTIEQAYPMVVPPTALETLPLLTWTRGRLDARYRLAERWSVAVFADDIRRDGAKASLARGLGQTGLNPPAVKTFDSKTMRAGAALQWKGEGLRADLGVSMGKVEGDRARNAAHTTNDDRTSVTVQGGVAWDATEKLTLLGRGAGTSVESTSTEVTGSEVVNELQQHTTTGVLAALWRPAKGWNVRLSGRLSTLDVDGGVTDELYVDRGRSRATLNADIGWRADARTSVDLRLRHDMSELDETYTSYGEGVLPVVVEDMTDQSRTTTTVALKARRRLNADTALKARLEYRNEDVDEKGTDSDRYFLGDRTLGTVRGTLGLSAKPMQGVRLEAGGEMLRRTFERNDVAGVDNSFDADRLTGLVSWFASPRLSLFGAASWGHEVADLPVSAVAPTDAAAIRYDTTTLRLAPGAVLSLANGLRLETQWELVQNRDSVENDYDRLTVRAGYPLGDKATVTAMFRRYELDENRWDDSILDLYALGLTATF
ncbi:MAG TPA: hypothetical protein PLH84_10220 [Candidatus Krumholzibacteria bacterium]|nr:hypothetical protein [Candidatus Krumholzibacteria bacterium]